MTRPLAIAAALAVVAFTAGPAVALLAAAAVMFLSIPVPLRTIRDLDTIHDFDRARHGLARAHQRIGGGES